MRWGQLLPAKECFWPHCFFTIYTNPLGITEPSGANHAEQTSKAADTAER